MIKFKQSRIGKPQPKPKKWQSFWKAIFLLLIVVMVSLSNKIYLFHTLPQFQNIKKGSMAHLFTYGSILAVVYIILDRLSHILFDEWVQKNLLRLDKYKDQELRESKSRTVVRLIFNIIFYSASSVASYLLIRQTKYYNSLFRGLESIEVQINYRYLQQATAGMQIYYYIQFGKHVGRNICHSLIQPEGNYYQFLLHHTIAGFLIIFSYSMDQWVIGILICFIHDAPDLFISIARLQRQIRYQNSILKTASDVVGLSSWIVLRIVFFGFYVVYMSWLALQRIPHVLNAHQLKVFHFPYIFMTVMNTFLIFMHLYWVYLLLQFVIRQSMSKKLAKHSHD